MIMGSGGENDILDEVNNVLLDKESKNGGMPESGKRYDIKTLKNCFAYIAHQAGVAITDLSMPKSPN